MDIKSLEELQRADGRARYFMPFGLGQKVGAEAAAECHQQVIWRRALASPVPEDHRGVI